MTSDFDPQSGQYGETESYPPPPAANQEPGGLGLRFAARLIDGILVGVVAFAIGFALNMVFHYWGGGLTSVVNGVISSALTFIYFVALETSQGATVGKKLLGLSVHGPDGAPKPTVQQSATRNAWTLLSIIPFMIGSGLALIAVIVIAVTINNSPTKQGIHDKLAGGTQVSKG
jgi:uncharacterized RDD family membrane protein YckC